MKKLYVILLTLLITAGMPVFASIMPGNPVLTKGKTGLTYEGSIYLTTQAEVDQFQANYPGITEISGELRIWNSSDITSLSGLNTVVSVGSLSIYNNDVLSDLGGLNNLTTVINDCYIGYTPQTAMSGLNGITSIGGYLAIESTGNLVSFTGFNNLQSVTWLYIDYNTSLTTLPQFLSLESAEYLGIYQNPALSVCSQSGICNILTDVQHSIYGNASGCDSIQQLQLGCGLPVTCGDVYLYSQDDVDNFAVNYGCAVITGQLYISGSDITHLSTLGGIAQVGSLTLYNLPSLTDYSGLNSLTTINGNLEISGDMPPIVTAFSGVTNIGGNVYFQTYGLQSFIGLNNVAVIGGNLNFSYNDSLTALPGMINLNSCNELSISGNDALVSLSGLNNLATVNGSLYISYNGALTGVSALSNLTQVNGNVDIYQNNSLQSLAGLGNIEVAGISGLYIRYNPLLSVCSLPNFCTYLAGGGSSSVYSNAPGCNSYSQLQVACGVPQNCNYVSLYSQYDVDNYIHNYGCTEVGQIYISGSDIENLDGLSMITSAESLYFSYASNLADISGLSNITSLSGSLQIYGETQSVFPALGNLTSVGSDLVIENTSMTHLPSMPGIISIGGSVSVYGNQNLGDLDGFSNLTSIGSSLTLSNNDALTDLSGLSALTSIEGSLSIYDNDILTSLSGLDNISPNGITSLGIGGNPQLSICTLANICAYLNNGGSHSIYGNATGCAEYAELAAVCNAGCPSDDVYLNSQADVDAFAIDYPTCTLIPGSLYVAGSDITDLTPLSNIATINGNLEVVYCETLASLEGLDALTEVRGNVSVYSNAALPTLSGLESLTTVEGSFNVNSNAAMTSLDGISSLTEIGNSIAISDNPSLISIAALSGITGVPNGNVSVYYNPSLVNLIGLSMTEISGELSIAYNAALTNLSAFSGLVSVDRITISGNDALTSVAGFGALTSVNYLTVEYNSALATLDWDSPISELDGVLIRYNPALTNLSGLSGLQSVSDLNISGNPLVASLGGLSSLTGFNYLTINENDSLVNLNGLQGLTGSEYGSVTISGNPALTSLSGLDNLTAIWTLNIGSSPALTSLSALSSLESVNSLYITDNGALTTLAGLDNIDADVLSYIYIQNNDNLAVCSLTPICEHISGGGSYTISGNAPGCANNFDVQLACGPISTCPTGSITFTSQLQIDQFILAYPGCTSLPNYVTISGSDITNLDGLANITSIGSPLTISNNPLLTDISGLDGLTSVGSLTVTGNPLLASLAAFSNISSYCYNVSINDNDALTSLAGLENLPVAGTIEITGNGSLTSLVNFVNLNGPDYLTISDNDSLTSLASLGGITSLYSLTVNSNDSLTGISIPGLTQCNYFSINGNNSLASFSGLDVNPNTIYGFSAYNNPNLSICNVPVICAFLDNGGYGYFEGNAEGCANTSEVQIGCGNGEPPTFGSVSPTSVTVCDGQSANLTISGLVADSASNLVYTFDGAEMHNATLYADASGAASFNPALYSENNGQTLTLVSIERTDVSTGTLMLSSDNTVSISVSEPITYYRDYDGDTYGNTWDSIVSCDGIPDGYVTNNTDCYDYDASLYNTTGDIYYDNDQDGYDSGITNICYGETIPAGYSYTTNGPDCDDYNADYHERFPFYYDADGDGYGTGSLQDACAADALTPPQNYSANNTDCSPFNANIYQSAALYIDVDGDGYNNGSNTVCYGASVPAGYSATTNGPDCDDNDAAKHTGYPFYADTDNDGYGTGNLVTACAVNASTPPVGYSANNTDCAPANGQAWQTGMLFIDNDGDGYDNGSQSICYGSAAPNGYSLTTSGFDCNDNNPAVNSGYSFYADTDGDGYGSSALIHNICALNAQTPPTGYSTNNSDCAPNDPGAYLGYPFYVDADGDGIGAGSLVTVCTPSASVAPAGYSLSGTDCDDNNASAYTSGILYIDADGDGYSNGSQLLCYGTIPIGYSAVSLGEDCNDNNAEVNPSKQEICNGFDDDCDGLVDDEDSSVTGGQTYYADADGDGYGNPFAAALRCSAGAGYVSNDDDCNDSDPAIHPNAQEICDGIDNDCDGLVDNDDPSVSPASQTTYYADIDADGYGNPAVSVQSCVAVPGYEPNSDDCDDFDAMLHPGQIWFVDADNDGYGTGATVASCTRPMGGFFANELTATTGDCNDNNPTINPAAQRLQFSGTQNFTSSLVYPQSGTLYTDFTFEITYYDANNQMPPATFPRVYLDYEGNGNFQGANDRAIIMTPFDVNDTNTADGKRYIGTINGLAYGTDWQTRVQVQDGSCLTEIGPFDYPDVQVQPNLQIFANDITFSSNHPSVSAPLQVNATVHNVSDFAAENFSVRLVNQYDPGIVYGDVIVPNVAPHSSATVTWNITTPAVPAWCPMQVIVDNANAIAESDELDNTAIRPFINGNYNLLGGIDIVNEGASPSVSYIGQAGYVSVFGRGEYFGTPTPLPDPSVAGATVTFTIVETGATYSGHTNSSGYFNVGFPAPSVPGVYHIQGELTDYTFIGEFTTQFERLVYVEPCPADLYVTIETTANTSIVSDNLPANTILAGESISGNFTVHNYCQPVGATVLDVSQTGGTAIADVSVPALASGGTYTSNFSNIVFNTPGTYTICATADATGLVSEISENNTACTAITVLPNLPDIYPLYGPGNSAQVCNSDSLGFTLYNGGGAVTGGFNCEVIVRKDGVQQAVLGHSVPNINALSHYAFSVPFAYPSAGNYTIELRCDIPMPNGNIVEINESNNTVIYPVTAYECVLKPDLTFLGCEAFDVSPVDPQFPGTVTYMATIYNAGNAVANGPFTVRFDLSSAFYDTVYNGSLAPGQSAVITVDAPSVAPATKNLRAMVDIYNAVNESSEYNNLIINSLCWDFEPVEREYPCGEDFWDYTQVVNQPVYLSVGVNQYNLYDASSVDVKFEVSGPGLSGTVNLGKATITNMEQTCYCPNTAALPYTFIFPEEGVYTFTMTVDPDNVYTECNEGNNVLVRQVTVTHLPDMRVLSQYINPSMLNPEPGQPITMNVTYENIGVTNLQDTMTLSVLVDDIPLASIPVTGLGTGENATVAIPMPWSSSVVGPHIIRAIIDSGNAISETNETNNEATRAIVVGEAANLHFDALSASNPSPSVGSAITINATIGNNGDLDAEADVVFYYMTDGLLQEQIGSMHVAVANNSSTNIQFPWIVLDNSTTIFAKIINASVLEFTYDDNEATTVIGGMSLTFESTTACAGQDNGTLTAIVSGGQPPYSYQWESGFNGATLTAAAGTYSVTVTDSTGLTASASGTISGGSGNTTFYADNDGDGFGNASNTVTACEQPEGYVANNEDCDDADAAVHTGYPFYADNDGDGFGFGSAVLVCAASPDSPPAGYVLDNSDCDDDQKLYLDADNDGYGSQTLVACGGVPLTGDCDDTRNTVHPNAFEIGYNLTDDDCDGLIDEGFPPKVSAVQSVCGTTLPAIDTQIVANIVSGAQGYRWRITAMNGPNAGHSQILDTPLRTMKFTQLASYAFATQYKVEVGVFYAGYPQPFAVSNCLVTTPAPTTSLTNCNQSVTNMNDVIHANLVPFAAGYRFRVTDPVNPSLTQDIDNNTRQLKMSQVTAFGVRYGKTYSVQVSVKNHDGTYLPFGPTCNVTTPAFPTTSLQESQCNGFVVSNNATAIYAISHPSAIAYAFELSGGGLPAPIEVVKPLRAFMLSDFPTLPAGATLTVRVRLIFNFDDPAGPHGKACTIVTPGVLRANLDDSQFDAVAHPNPFADSFAISVATSQTENINVKVYDMAGRLLEDMTVKAARIESLRTGERYPAGVYNVIVTQGAQTQTLRVVKR